MPVARPVRERHRALLAEPRSCTRAPLRAEDVVDDRRPTIERAAESNAADLAELPGGCRTPQRTPSGPHDVAVEHTAQPVPCRLDKWAVPVHVSCVLALARGVVARGGRADSRAARRSRRARSGSAAGRPPPGLPRTAALKQCCESCSMIFCNSFQLSQRIVRQRRLAALCVRESGVRGARRGEEEI